MKILITGATGFLGGWIVADLLKASADLIVLRNRHSQTSYKDNSQYALKGFDKHCKEVFLDILEYSDVEKLIKQSRPDAVVHLAAVGDVTVAAQDPKYTYEVSSNGTLNLLEAIRLHNPETVFLSHTTDKVYSGNAVPFSEEMLLNPSHIYEAAKVSQEHLAKIYARSYGLRITTIRCGNYFGGYDFNFNRIVPYAIKCAITNSSVNLRSNGSFTRDFLYIKDAVLVNQMVLNEMLSGRLSSKSGEAFNFSLELELSVLEIVEKILELCDSDVDVVTVGDGSAEIPNMRLDCTKSKTELNWAPEYTIERGLAETINFYRSYLEDALTKS